MSVLGGGGPHPVASVVIPAHNEEAVIARGLRTLLAGAPDGSLEVVVVCNGCDDDTASVARAAAPGATVVELAVAGKAGALNVGDDHCSAFPRLYIDADVEVGFDAVSAVVGALTSGDALCAAPQCVFDTTGASWIVRRFYDAWKQLPYVRDGRVGGMYGFSAEGRRRFDRFPDVTADDLFVRHLFDTNERVTVPDASFVVHTPRSVAGLLAVRERTYRGNVELATAAPELASTPTFSSHALVRAFGRSPLSVTIYLCLNLFAKVRWRSRRGAVVWERDHTARATAAVDPRPPQRGRVRPS